MDLELLLAHADDQSPVLAEGLPVDSATSAVTADSWQGEPFTDFAEDPNDLPIQRWGLIAPEGPLGDRLLDLVAPLQKQREADQGARARIYRVPPGMDMEAARRWKQKVYWDESVPEEELPRYLLILGDLDQVSLELQQALSSNVLVGRLACARDEGYAAYVEKVLRWERAPSAEAQARALFFTVRDGTAATSIGYNALVRPSFERCRERQEKGSFPAKEIQNLPCEDASEAKATLFDHASRPDPAMLFTMSHGLGAPRGGFKSESEQRAIQGAISLGSGMRVTAEDVASQPFLPGGIWFFLACYGGGTPSISAYEHWLARLRDAGGFGGRVDSVLAGLPKAGSRPFIAALPQAALANPNGPLAVMAHIDLAWTYSFQDIGPDGQDRPSRFHGIFRSLVNGARSGPAYHQLLRYLSETSVALADLYNKEARLETAGKPVNRDAVSAQKLANFWMLREDLAGYLLLGDPATRLPVKRREVWGQKDEPRARAAPEARPAASPAPTQDHFASNAEPRAEEAAPKAVEQGAKPQGEPARDAARMEEAVLAVLGKEDEKTVAANHEITNEQLTAWVKAYKEAGLAALRKLR
jgi:hypothetical protein